MRGIVLPSLLLKPSTKMHLAPSETVINPLDSRSLTVAATPWGTRGYDDIRIRGNRESLGRGIRPQIASLVDLTRMLEASDRPQDAERLRRLRRVMELERQLNRHRGRTLEL